MLHRQVKLFPSSGSQCARTACHVAWASEKGYCAKKKPTLPASVVVLGGLLPRRPWICRLAPAVAKNESWLTDSSSLTVFFVSPTHTTHACYHLVLYLLDFPPRHIPSSRPLLGERHANISGFVRAALGQTRHIHQLLTVETQASTRDKSCLALSSAHMMSATLASAKV